MQNKNQLGTEKIPKLLFKLAIPSIVAQMVNIIYNIVDRIYIGRMEDGALAMSGLAVGLPVVTLVMGFAMLVGTGGAPLAAIKMGEKDTEGANKILTNSFICLTTVALLLTLIISVFLEDILFFFGADETNLHYAKDYVSIYILGTICVSFSFGLNAYITTQGFAAFSMATVVIGAVINLILDPIFIFTLDFGVKGAAIATVISQGVSAIWVMLFFFGKKTILKIRKKYLKPDPRIVFAIMSIGVSPFVMYLTETLLQTTFNNQMSRYGGTLAVGTMAVLNSLYQMMTTTIGGLCQGAQPISSYNYGAKNYSRVRQTFKLLFFVSISFSFVATSIVQLFPEFFANLFVTDPDGIRLASWAIGPFLFGAFTFGAQTSCQQTFLALGQAKRSLSMALFRKVVLLIPLILLLPNLIGETQFAINMADPISDLVIDSGRVFAVLSAETVSDFLAACTTTTLFFIFYKTHLCKKDEVIQ